QLPRYYLGLSCAIGGTGFMVATDVLKKIGWDATSLTEDLEFTIKLVLTGMKVSWSHQAVVYDEKPLRMSQSWRQRKRWMQGHCDCAVRYFGKMIRKAVKDRDIVVLDCTFNLIRPVMIVFNYMVAFISVMRFIYIGFNHYMSTIGVQPLLDWLGSVKWSNVLLFLFFTYMNIIFIIVEKKFSWKVLKYYITSPFYALTWVPIIILGFFERNNKVWVHTVHTRALEIEALEKTG
ncbi:MAG TPA: glycosyltransferase family 2 protein, partial [Clostridia bacterium]